MASLKYEIQKALYSRLITYAPLNGTHVYDLPMQDTPFPYITIGYADAQQSDVNCKRSWRVYLRVESWSDKPGYTEVNDISFNAVEALHRYPLQLAGYRLIDISHINTINIRAPDGQLSHAVSEFLAHVEAL